MLKREIEELKTESNKITPIKSSPIGADQIKITPLTKVQQRKLNR